MCCAFPLLKSMLNQSIRLLERTASDLPVSGPPTNHVPQQFTRTQLTSSIRSTSINAEQRLRSSSIDSYESFLSIIFPLFCPEQSRRCTGDHRSSAVSHLPECHTSRQPGDYYGFPVIVYISMLQ
jgi:hypothetical protein